MDKIMTSTKQSPLRNTVPPADTSAKDALVDGLVKALPIGLVRGVAAIVGHDAAGTASDSSLAGLVRELIGHDILVLAAGTAAPAMASIGLTEASGLDEAGAGLAQFCAYCDVPPVLPTGDDTPLGSILDLCARLANGLGGPLADLPVAVVLGTPDGAADALEAVFGPGVRPETDTAADAISRRITARRLALGFNDRFDGTVYS